jgi:hypothetical protein
LGIVTRSCTLKKNLRMNSSFEYIVGGVENPAWDGPLPERETRSAWLRKGQREMQRCIRTRDFERFFAKVRRSAASFTILGATCPAPKSYVKESLQSGRDVRYYRDRSRNFI